MIRYRLFSIFVAVIYLIDYSASTRGDVIAHWTYETSVPTTAGPHFAELGLQAGSAQSLGFHSNGSVVYSNPVGNGSLESFSSNFWSVGDYYQFQVDLTGYENATFQWDQTRSSTGPGDFALQYSIDGLNFFDVISSYTVDAITWSSATYNSASTFGPVALPSAVNNQTTVFVRLTANVAGSNTAGSNRVDDIIIGADVIVIPEPSALFLLSLIGLSAVIGIRSRD